MPSTLGLYTPSPILICSSIVTFIALPRFHHLLKPGAGLKSRHRSASIATVTATPAINSGGHSQSLQSRGAGSDGVVSGAGLRGATVYPGLGGSGRLVIIHLR